MLREHFAAIVSHELKAPLGAIQQNIFAFEHELADSLAEGQLKRIDRMKGSIDNLLKLIHTWLRVITTDIKALQENFEPTSISDVITTAIESVEPHAIRKDIDIEVSFDEDLKHIQGDEVTLGETIINIVNNAIKYSHMGTKIRVNATQDGDEIVITIKDRGVGIAEEDLPHIFGDFYVGKSAPESERGSGLGLAITRRIIEAHGGTISVESALEKGSMFKIRLPIMGSEVFAAPVEDAGILTNTM
jgi:signal transduction histidine kinase